MVLLPCAAIRLLRSARLHRSSGTPNIVLNRPSFATSGNSCFYRRDGEVYRWAASCGYSNQEHEWIKQSMPALPLAPGRGSCVGRTVLEGRPVQIADVLADSEYAASQRRDADSASVLSTVGRSKAERLIS